MRLRICSRNALMAAIVTATTAIVPIAGGPDPCTREPTHSASSGLPVHTFSEVSAIAQTRPTRLRRCGPDRGSETICDWLELKLETPSQSLPGPRSSKPPSGACTAPSRLRERVEYAREQCAA